MQVSKSCPYGCHLQKCASWLFHSSFLVFCTNVGYSVVAEFLIQHEDTTSITEALTILCKRWDECDIEVGNFMIDCQQSEENAIRAVFPTVLCICACSADFRRGSSGWSTPKIESANIKHTVWHFLEWWVMRKWKMATPER